jgi:type III pantothenate kinase
MDIGLDIGNTHIYGGIFHENDIRFTFRYPTQGSLTSDQLGIFLKAVLRENKLDPDEVKAICIASVVPTIDYTVRAACVKYFGITPLFLKPGVKTGLKLNIKNPLELGADRIANAVAALNLYPKQDLIIVDYGTATTFCAVSKESEYLGGAIIPGIKLAMESLFKGTSKLSPVDIVNVKQALGKTTETQIQIGLIYSQVGTSREIIRGLQSEAFPNSRPLVIATGGYAHLFEEEGLFASVVPDLVLYGLQRILEKNT